MTKVYYKYTIHYGNGWVNALLFRPIEQEIKDGFICGFKGYRENNYSVLGTIPRVRIN